VDVRDTPLEPLGYQQLTALDTPTALTVPKRARSALFKAEAQALRWKDDTLVAGATAVSASSGMVLDVGDEFFYSGKLSQMRWIEVVDAAILNVSYYA
jgi:hypothetical protein